MTSRFLWCASAPVWVFLCLLAHPLRAEGGTPDAAAAQRSLREIIDIATAHFKAGEYDEAITAYYAAYERKPVKALLFNIAQAHRKAGHYQEALATYERFLREDPKSTLVPEAEAHAAAMRAKLEAEHATAEREAAERLAKQRQEEAERLAKERERERQKADAALLAAAKPDKPVYKKWWFWTLIGSAVAAAVIVPTAVVVARGSDPTNDLGTRMLTF